MLILTQAAQRLVKKKAECDVCGNGYGDLIPHNYENGECTVCQNPDPNAGTTATTTDPDDDTETTTETTTDEGGSQTSPAGTTASAGTTGSSSAWWEPAPVFTTASAVTTTVTTTVTAAPEEIIYGDETDETGEDISAGAGVYEENRDIPGGLIGFAFIALLAGAAVLIKKLVS